MNVLENITKSRKKIQLHMTDMEHRWNLFIFNLAGARPESLYDGFALSLCPLSVAQQAVSTACYKLNPLAHSEQTHDLEMSTMQQGKYQIQRLR